MIAILVAAGSSRRMGFDKLMADLAGQPVAAHTLLAFEQAPSVSRIVIVTQPERIEVFQALVRAIGLRKPLAIVPGGAERHLSVAEGVRAAAAAADDFLAVHDMARPLVIPAAIEACLALAQRHGAAACAAPVADTLKRADAAGGVTESVDRRELWAMQTPQIIRAGLLEKAYQAVLAAGLTVTDEVSAVQAFGDPVFLYDNPEPNFKITHPRDLALARLVLAARTAGA
jgi:2-C-methyl-D-erythritol 4-phosphate cytidylyltransferase